MVTITIFYVLVIVIFYNIIRKIAKNKSINSFVKNKISKVRRQARKLLNTRSHLNLDKYTFIMT